MQDWQYHAPLRCDSERAHAAHCIPPKLWLSWFASH
jgi:hypothetical protein